MWYGGYGKDGHDRIHLAVSPDGQKWTRRGVVVSNDEAKHVNDPSVVRVGGTYFMFYTRAVVDVTYDIAMATSQDGVHWNKQGTVLKPGAAGEWDSLCVGRPSVMLRGQCLQDVVRRAEGHAVGLAGGCSQVRHVEPVCVGYAASPDGIHWTKHTHPVFDHDAGAVDVKKINDVYVMAYESAEGTQVATSPDGIYNWTAKGLWVPLSGRDFDQVWPGHADDLRRAAGPGRDALHRRRHRRELGSEYDRPSPSHAGAAGPGRGHARAGEQPVSEEGTRRAARPHRRPVPSIDAPADSRSPATDLDQVASHGRPGRPAGPVALDAVIERVALDRDAAGLGDQAADLGDGHFLRGLGAGLVVDLLVDDGAVDVVGAEGEGDLGGLDARA